MPGRQQMRLKSNRTIEVIVIDPMERQRILSRLKVKLFHHSIQRKQVVLNLLPSTYATFPTEKCAQLKIGRFL